MFYLNDKDIKELQESWKKYAQIIVQATQVQVQDDFHQPIKPYLRFKNPIDRIIAMPAYLGGSFNISGIKWIASFPDNLKLKIPRAHSVLILNDTQTGVPLATLESGMISGIRTAAVSASVLIEYINSNPKNEYIVGVSGYGPIAKLHIEMLREILGPKIDQIKIFDINQNNQDTNSTFPLNFCNTWQKAYKDADIFITCTSSSKAYIDLMPKLGSLHLNVSLRDYTPEIINKCSHVIIDDWDEVCRENTDIENTHIKYGLQKSQTQPLSTFFGNQYLSKTDLGSNFLSFHPMGMAIFDMAIAHRFYTLAKEKKLGLDLSNPAFLKQDLCSKTTA